MKFEHNFHIEVQVVGLRALDDPNASPPSRENAPEGSTFRG
jgi:hypothetical protein